MGEAHNDGYFRNIPAWKRGKSLGRYRMTGCHFYLLQYLRGAVIDDHQLRQAEHIHCVK